MAKTADDWAADAVETARVEVMEQEEEQPLRVHISDFEIVETRATNYPIVYKTVGDVSMSTFTQETLDWMRDEQRPMHISADIVHCFFMEEQNEDLMATIRCLTEAAIEGGKHRISFSTARYNPDGERHWFSLSELNNEIRSYTQLIGEQSLSLHKAFLSPENGVLACFAQCYEEFYRKTSLGKTPSDLGVQIVIGWITQHHQHAYVHQRRPKKRILAPLPMPLPISMTKAWYEDEYMVRLLKSRGLFRGRRTRSTSRHAPPRRTSHRTVSRERSDSQVSGARPNGGRSPMSNGCLERLLHQVTKGGRTRDPYTREREASRVAGRISSLYQDKCAEVVSLRVEVETLKLQMDLMKDKREGDKELELNELRLELRRLKDNEKWQDASYDRLAKVKETLLYENKQLEEQLEDLKISKKERRQKKKEKKQRK